MAGPRTFLINASTRHAIFVNRFAGRQAKLARERLNQLRDEIAARLARQELTVLSRERLTALYREIDQLAEVTYQQIGSSLTEEMRAFGEHEAEFSAKMFDRAAEASFAVPAVTAIEAAITSTPLLLPVGSQRITIEQALAQFSRQKRRELIRTINSGVIAGRTNDQIIKDMTFVTNKIQRNHAEALTRTVTNHVSTVARQITMEENQDILEGYEWVATLDGHTTHTCQALDGQVFPVNSTTRPPAHWGCRSTTIPVVKKEFSVGGLANTERPARGADGIEQVSSRTSYGSWLKKQPKSFQEEVLGPKRAALFRQGGLAINKFVDSNFKPYTLDELRSRERVAFEEAGLINETGA